MAEQEVARSARNACARHRRGSSAWLGGGRIAVPPPQLALHPGGRARCAWRLREPRTHVAIPGHQVESGRPNRNLWHGRGGAGRYLEVEASQRRVRKWKSEVVECFTMSLFR